MSSPVWWAQLVRSTAIEHASIVRGVIQEWIDGSLDATATTARFLWDEYSAVPTALSIQAVTGPLDLFSLLDHIRRYLGEDEVMIFVSMTEGDVYDQGFVTYHAVTNCFIGTIAGDAMVKRVERTALVAQEEIQKLLDGQGSVD